MLEKLNQFKQQLSEQFSAQFDKQRQQVAQNPQLQQAVQWYQSKAAYEQNILKGLAAVVLVLLVWSLFYAPLLNSRTQAQAALEKNLATYQLIASNAGQFGGVNASANQNRSVLAAVTQAARKHSVNLSRYEQDGAQLRVWLEKVAFDEAIQWLEALQKQDGIVVSQISIDQSASAGRVDIRATLGR